MTPEQQARVVAVLTEIAEYSPFIDTSEGAFPEKCFFCSSEESEGLEGHMPDCPYGESVQLLRELGEA